MIYLNGKAYLVFEVVTFSFQDQTHQTASFKYVKS